MIEMLPVHPSLDHPERPSLGYGSRYSIEHTCRHSAATTNVRIFYLDPDGVDQARDHLLAFTWSFVECLFITTI